MHRLHNLTIIGTSHIAQQSIDEIKSTIEKEKPDIVAVELDKNRLYSLMQKEKQKHLSFRQIKSIGFSGFIFAVIGSYVQQKLGKIVQVQPGEDMLTAVKLAQKSKAKIRSRDYATCRSFGLYAW